MCLTSEKKWVKECKEEVKENYWLYFERTTVHGLKYLTEPRRPWPEKVLWFFGVLVGMLACVFLMYQTYARWAESPVRLTTGVHRRSVWEMPFPAVTVCPELRPHFNCTRWARHGAHADKLFPPEEKKSFTEKTCRTRLEEYIGNQTNVTNARLFLKYVDFQPILTKKGLCFSFNMMPSSEFFQNETFQANQSNYLQYQQRNIWVPNGKYKNSDGKEMYPYRAWGIGEELGLHFQLQKKTHDALSFVEHGYQVLLHSPLEFPRPERHSISVPLGSALRVAVSPLEVQTDTALRRSTTPQQRQCYFPDEKALDYFKFYTRSNCELECLAKRVQKACHCVEPYMPRMPETQVCKMKDEDCIRNISVLIYKKQAGVKLNSKEKDMHLNVPCSCLRNCNEIQYLSKESGCPIYQDNTNRFNGNSPNTDPAAADKRMPGAEILIYYKDSPNVSLQREEVFDTVSLLANLGGLMGLCMGISLLSVIEFFYWMLIRPCCQRIKQSNPQLRSIRKMLTIRKNTEPIANYSRQRNPEEITEHS